MYYARFRVNNSGTRMNNGRMMDREKKRNFTIEIVPNDTRVLSLELLENSLNSFSEESIAFRKINNGEQ